MNIIIMLILILILMFKLFGPPKPNGIVLYFANLGTGKTTFLSKVAVKEQKKMKKKKSKYEHIVSNAVISGVTYIPDIRKLLKQGALKKTLILIDEASIVYNNRKMNLSEAEIQYFKLIRHYTSTAIVVSQSYDDIDVTLRRLYTQIYIFRRLPLITLIQPIKKRIGIDEISKQIIDEYKFCNPFSWRIFLRPLYFKYFNSWWIPADVPIIDVNLFEKQLEYKRRSIKQRWFGTVKEKEIGKIC